jgi:hypothetical protein
MMMIMMMVIMMNSTSSVTVWVINMSPSQREESKLKALRSTKARGMYVPERENLRAGWKTVDRVMTAMSLV